MIWWILCFVFIVAGFSVAGHGTAKLVADQRLRSRTSASRTSVSQKQTVRSPKPGRQQPSDLV